MGTVGSLLLLVGAIVLVKAKGSASVESVDDLVRPELGWAWAVAGLATLVILVVSLNRLWQLSRGGGAVAEMLGGRLVDRRTTDPAERRLLNVVDEMALASGVPVPPVYVLEEPSINAFAAGTTHADAALGVTRGCIEQLDRDELQGVIAHEFSHVFHADMRINARTAAAIAGIMAIATIGYVLVRFVGPALARSGGGSRKNNGAGIGIAVILAGVVVGLVFGIFLVRRRILVVYVTILSIGGSPVHTGCRRTRLFAWQSTVLSRFNKENVRTRYLHHNFAGKEAVHLSFPDRP
jgi:Zn-dependent protease with chaperone function